MPVRIPRIALSAVLVLGSAVHSRAASDSATATVTVTATFAPRTALEVSAQLLEFDAAEPGQPVTASVDFAASARTARGTEVLLIVEPLRATTRAGGAAEVETSVTFDGVGEGTQRGRIGAAKPAVAGRWVGSGRRTGRLVFALRATAPGRYTLPVRFLLSAP